MDVTGFCRVDVDVVILPNRAPFMFRRTIPVSTKSLTGLSGIPFSQTSIGFVHALFQIQISFNSVKHGR
jgi:hypothetical protein